MGEEIVWKWSKMVEFPTFMGSWPWPWPWIRAWSLPFFMSHRVLPVYQISSKSKKLFVDGRTDGNLPPIVLGRLPKSGSWPKNQLKLLISTSIFEDWHVSTHTDPTCNVHMPCKLDRHVVKSPTGTFIVLHALTHSSYFGLLGEQSFQKCEIPYAGRRWTTVQNLMPTALSSAEKSVTVQKNTQTVNDISTPCLSACVDNDVLH